MTETHKEMERIAFKTNIRTAEEIGFVLRELPALLSAYAGMKEENARLREALERMDRMHELMMQKVNHGASFYDAECLREMNEAPLQAAAALSQKAEGDAS